LDCTVYIARISQINAHPTRFWKHVVRLRHTTLDQFIAHIQRERNIHKPVTVNVTNFAAAHAELRAAKSVRCMPDSSQAVTAS